MQRERERNRKGLSNRRESAYTCREQKRTNFREGKPRRRIDRELAANISGSELAMNIAAHAVQRIRELLFRRAVLSTCLSQHYLLTEQGSSSTQRKPNEYQHLLVKQ